MKIDKQKVLSEFSDRLQLFLDSTSVKYWRDEVKVLYAAMAGHQWNANDAADFKSKNRPMTTVNKMSPIIKAIAGHGVINRSEINIIPRRDTPTETTEDQTNVMDDAVKFLQDESDFFSENGATLEDDYVCGIGGTVTYFDYTNPDKVYGDVKVDRIFPAYLLYDNTNSKRNFKDAHWAGYVEVVNRQWLFKEIEKTIGETYSIDTGVNSKTTRGISDFLFFVENATTDDIDLLYHYEWREDVKTKSLRNIIIQLADDKKLMVRAAEFEEAHGVDFSEAYLMLEMKEYNAFREMLKQHHEEGAPDYRELIEAETGSKSKYFRARIAHDVILDCTESWANDFTIQYKTGYYDEINRTWYGIGRGMLPVQRLMNKAVSYYDSYLDSVPKGGMIIEEDALTDPKGFKDTRANEQALTLVAPDALRGGKIQEKSIPQVPTGLSDFIGLMSQLLPSVVGLPPDFLGQVQSGNMTNSLFSKIIKQAYMVLVHFNEAERVYMRRQGRVFMDAVHIISENYDGLVLERISSVGEEFSISKSEISQDYRMKIIERPKSEDEKLEAFQNIAEIAGTLLNKPNPVDLTPMLVNAYPYELEDKKAMQQAMQPPPPQEPPAPDPLMQALLEAETKEKIAMANLNEARALVEMESIQGRDHKVTQKDTITGGVLEKREITTETTTN